MAPPSGENLTTIVYIAGLRGEKHSSPKRVLLLICNLFKIIWTSQKAAGKTLTLTGNIIGHTTIV